MSIDTKSDPRSRSKAAVGAAEAKSTRRRRFPRFWLALLIVAALVWLLPSIVAHSPLLSWGVKVATADLDGSVTIRSAALGWFSPIAAQGVELRDAQGKVVLDISGVQCDRSLLGLILNSSNLGNVRLDNPKLSLLLRDDGSNLEDLLAKYLAPQTPQAKSSAKLALSLQLVDGSVSVTDQRTSQCWQIQKLGLGLDMSQGTDGPLGVELLADLSDARRPGSLKASVKMAAEGNRAELGITGLPLSLVRSIVWRLSPGTTVDGRLSTNVAVTWGGTAKSSVQVDLDAEGFSLTAPALQTDLVRLERIHATCLAAWKGDELDIQKSTIDCDVGSASIVSTMRLGGMSLDSLLHGRHDISGRVDLARLGRLLPATLRLRRQVSINSGEVAFGFRSDSGSAGAGGAASPVAEGAQQWHGQLNLANLAATASGRQISWKQPVSLVFDARQGPDQLPVGSLKCESDFLRIHANGAADALAGSFSFNLKQLADDLGQFVDLGEMQMAGEGWGNINWKRSPQRQFDADGEIRLHNFELGLPNRPAWREDDLVALLSAKGQTDFGQQTRIDAATVSIKSGTDQIDVRLLQPVGSLQDGGTWPLRIQAQGQLQSWPGRLAAWLPAKDCRFTGNYNLDVVGTASTQSVDLRQVKLTAGPLVVASPWLNVNEPQVVLNAVGSWNQAQRRLQVEPATLTCATIGIQANNVVVAVPETGPMELAGTLGYQGDVGRLRQWLSNPAKPSSWRLAGQLKGALQVRQAAGVIHGETTTEVTNLAVVDQKGQQFQEPLMRLTARGDYTNASGVLQLDQCELTSDVVAASAKGRIAPVSGQNNADISGNLGYDFERLCGLLQPWIGANVHVAGRGTSQAWFRGPFDLRTGSAAASVRWDWANLYGLRLGAGELKATMADGIAKIEPLDLTVSQGRMHLRLACN